MSLLYTVTHRFLMKIGDLPAKRCPFFILFDCNFCMTVLQYIRKLPLRRLMGMRENVYKTNIMDIQVKTILFDEAFHVKEMGNTDGIIPRFTQLHQHSTYEIFFVLDGTITVTDGLGSRRFSNCAVIIPPKYEHYSVLEINNGYCFYFSFERLEKKKRELFSRISDVLSREILSLVLSEDMMFYVTRFAKSIDENASNEKISHLLYLLFSELLEGLATTPQSAGSFQNKYIHIIETYVYNSEGGKITLGELARKLYLCPKQVSRIIKQEYGCSFTEFVNRRKLTVACAMLKHTDLSISHIASAAGYEYENYFFTIFKKTYGVTPLQYRKINNL